MSSVIARVVPVLLSALGMVVVHRALLPSTTLGRVDVRIHGAEGKSVSSICTMGVLTCHAVVVINDNGAAKGRKNCLPVLPSFCGSRDLETFEVL